MAEEKIYTVPLRREFLKVARYNRSKKAMKALKEFLKKHLKEDVKIGRYLNERISKSRKSPPGKIKIRLEGEKGKYKAELINAPREEVKEEKKRGRIEKLKEKITGKEEKIEEKLDKEIVIKKEETKKAIENVPKEKLENKEETAEVAEKKHAHRKEETFIPKEKVGLFRKD